MDSYTQNRKLEPIKEVNEDANDPTSPVKIHSGSTPRSGVESRILPTTPSTGVLGGGATKGSVSSRVLSSPHSAPRVAPSGSSNASPASLPSRVNPSAGKGHVPPPSKPSPSKPSPSSPPPPTPTKSPSSNRQDITEGYRNFTTDRLINECHRRGLTPVGSRTDMIETLVNDDIAKVTASDANDV